jgi:predicted  nucleic acid-binding Zn-ribbon protein
VMNDDAQEAALGLLGLNVERGSSLVPQKRKQFSSAAHLAPTLTIDTSNQDSIDCICGYTFDDGFSIMCDGCQKWCHTACFDISEAEIPEEFLCIDCRPRKVDVERAVKLQRRKMEAARAEEDKWRMGGKRRTSPVVDRKQRRSSGNGSANVSVPPSCLTRRP